MAVDMEKLKAENPDAHAYILELRGEAAGHRTDAAEWKSKHAELAPQVATLTQARDTLAAEKATLETANRKSQVESWRSAAALKHGLTDAQAKRLQGDTAEALLADAETFSKEVVPAKRVAPVDPTLNQPDPQADGSGVSQAARDFGSKLTEMLGSSTT